MHALHCAVCSAHIPPMDKQWFQTLQRRKGVTSFDLGERLGRDRTIVARILNGRQKMKMEEAKVFAELLEVPLADVLEHAGMTDAATAQQLQPGFRDGDAAPWIPSGKATDERDRKMALDLGQRSGIDVWSVNTRAMSLAGYLPGDKMLVDGRNPSAARSGDVVIAQVYDWQNGTAKTVLRQFQRPALVAHSADPDHWVSHIVDDNNVAIRGIVRSQWRFCDGNYS